MRVVIKFGGASLSNGERVHTAARVVRDSKYDEKVVVVSAPGKTTDQLLELVSNFEKIDEGEYADILSMGERTSVKVFSSALKSLGVNVKPFDPSDDNFPIITDGNLLNAKVDLEETRKRCESFILPWLKKGIVVIPGFVGRNGDKVTLLGRGGSDITATVLGNCLNAQEVILVKDSAGVMSADPAVVRNAEQIGVISIEEMYALAHGGAKVIRPEALFYKSKQQRLRVVQFGKPLEQDGTEIVGSIDTTRPRFLTENGIEEITIVSEQKAQTIADALERLGTEIVGIGSSPISTSFFFKGKKWEDACTKVYETNGIKAVSGRRGIGCISIVHPYLVEQPGAVAKVATLLSLNGINIYEITSSKGSLTLFLDEPVMDKALTLLSKGVTLG
ncbi:MAG: hypothetical protein QXQ39_02160 [Conexivisphaerales archaeon]